MIVITVFVESVLTACSELREKHERAGDIEAVAGWADSTRRRGIIHWFHAHGRSIREVGKRRRGSGYCTGNRGDAPQMTRAVTVAASPAPSDGATRYYAPLRRGWGIKRYRNPSVCLSHSAAAIGAQLP